MTGGRIDAWIPMSDGERLAVTFFLPDDSIGPQPCILEALPYRKDDLTSSYRPEYTRLRDEYHYAVARLDVRGTGSSSGRATDEYPYQEQRDLAEVVEWLAAQPWCDGNVGMYGTSYSGFNSLHMAAQCSPALKGVIAIYATDDRFNDDVHYYGGVRKWLDLIDYCHYMTPMNALPPVPAVWGPGWRDEWLARIAEHEPWMLTWNEHQRRDAYWQHGSIRPDYHDITCPVLLVVGWADGYRNNSFRTIEALRSAGRPAEMLAGPWPHAATDSCLPGPRIDLVPEMAAWWDRWLRGTKPSAPPPPARWYAKSSHPPAVDLDTVPGHWRADVWPTPRGGRTTLALESRPPYQVAADIGLPAWLSCSGHLPWGQADDQRTDDVRSVTWDWPVETDIEIAGNPIVRLSLSSSAPVASVALRLCDVASDEASTLVTRGFLNLTRRGGMATAEPLAPGQTYEVEFELEAMAWRWTAGRTIRLALAGAEWPNAIASPQPVTLEVSGGSLILPTYDPAGSPFDVPTFVPGESVSSEDPTAVEWHIGRDVLRHVTSARVDHGGEPYGTPYGSAHEHYGGEVTVNTVTFDQTADADVVFDLQYDDDCHGRPVEVRVVSHLSVTADAEQLVFAISLRAEENGVLVRARDWHHAYPRDLA